MANYSSNLKQWGATGQEFPDNYSYLEDEAPVDDWDNFLTYNLISDVRSHLIPLTNSRIETDYGTTRPTSPEDGHVFYDSGAPVLEQYRATDSSWHALALDEDLDAHVADTTNPHSVSLEQARAQNSSLSGNVGFGGNNLLGLNRADFNSGDVRVNHAVRNFLVEEYDGTAWTTRLSVDETGASVTGALSVSSSLSVTGGTTLGGNASFGGSNALGVGLIEFSNSDGDTNQWTATEDATSGNLEVRSAGTPVLDVGSSIIDVLGSLRESGDRVATRVWANNNADVPNADYADNAGDADTVDGNHAADLGVTVEDSATVIYDPATGVNFGSNLNVTDDGDGTVTVDSITSSDTHTGVSEGGTQTLSSVDDIDFLGHLNVLDQGDGTVSVDPAHNHDSRYVDQSGDTMSGGLTIGGDLTATNGEIVWDESATYIPQARLQNDTVTVAGNAVSLGGSTSVAHGNLSDAPASAHHTRYSNEEAQDAVGTILNTDFSYDDTNNVISLASNSVTVAGNTVSLGGSTTIAHADISSVGSSDHHVKTATSDVNSANWSDYEIQKNGTDGTGIINFKT